MTAILPSFFKLSNYYTKISPIGLYKEKIKYDKKNVHKYMIVPLAEGEKYIQFSIVHKDQFFQIESLVFRLK